MAIRFLCAQGGILGLGFLGSYLPPIQTSGLILVWLFVLGQASLMQCLDKSIQVRLLMQALRPERGPNLLSCHGGKAPGSAGAQYGVWRRAPVCSWREWKHQRQSKRCLGALFLHHSCCREVGGEQSRQAGLFFPSSNAAEMAVPWQMQSHYQYPPELKPITASPRACPA